MSSLARTLALGLALGIFGSAHAGWKTYFIKDPGIQKPTTKEELRDRLIELYGNDTPEVDEKEFGLGTTMPANIVSTKGRFRSQGSFDFDGTPVHYYRDIYDTSGKVSSAISIRNRNLDWLWTKFTDADGDGIRDDLLGPGGKQIIDAFKQWIDSTDENGTVKTAAKQRFTKKIVDGVFADLDLEHPWVPRAIHVIPQTGRGKTWSITDSGRGHSLAHRAIDLVEKIIHDASFGALPEGTEYEFGSEDIYGLGK